MFIIGCVFTIAMCIFFLLIRELNLKKCSLLLLKEHREERAYFAKIIARHNRELEFQEIKLPKDMSAYLLLLCNDVGLFIADCFNMSQAQNSKKATEVSSCFNEVSVFLIQNSEGLGDKEKKKIRKIIQDLFSYSARAEHWGQCEKTEFVYNKTLCLKLNFDDFYKKANEQGYW